VTLENAQILPPGGPRKRSLPMWFGLSLKRAFFFGFGPARRCTWEAG